MAGLAAVEEARDDLAVLVFDINQDRRACSIAVPRLIGDVLEVADILAGIEIDRYERICVEIVARTDRAIEGGRRISHHEVDALRPEVDRGILPYRATEGLVRI